MAGSHLKPIEASHGSDDAHAEEHHASYATYIAVTIALGVLTAMSFGIGHFLMKTPTIAWTGMMAVSCCKAMLVILFFMHLKYEANWKYVLTIPASMMSVFLLLMLIPDIGMRTNKYSAERWLYASVPYEPAAADEHEHEEDHEHESPETPEDKPSH